VPYSFRVLVENPSETFINVNDRTRWWRIETRRAKNNIDTRLDLNFMVPSFPVHQRIKFFSVESLVYIGRARTTLKVNFNIFYDLPPTADVIITAPKEVQFDLSNVDPVLGYRECVDSNDPQTYQDLNGAFGKSVIKDATTLPEYVKCRVSESNVIRILNTSGGPSGRGGRTLMAGPTYEVLIADVTNPNATPELNIWGIQAHTTSEFGIETWANEGYKIFPELTKATVSSSNPGVGLFTKFTIEAGTLTRIPVGGSIFITAPRQDFYFGPRLPLPNQNYDPLDSSPPPAGDSPPRPAIGSPDHECTVEAPEAQSNVQFICPISFQSCLLWAEYMQADAVAVVKQYTNQIADLQPICEEMQQKCADRDYAAFFDCRSRTVEKPADQLAVEQAIVDEFNAGSTVLIAPETGQTQLEITLKEDVTILADKLLVLLITGYNTRLIPLIPEQNEWVFATRSPDSGKTVLDEKKGVDGFALMGVIRVEEIVAQVTRVSTQENRVTIKLKLTNPAPARSLLRIIHPEQFNQVSSGSTGSAGFGTSTSVQTGNEIPRKAVKRHNGNVVELELTEDEFKAKVLLQITITLANPFISPPESENIWRVASYTAPTTTDVKIPEELLTMVDCNFDVQGFRIYGDFRSAQVASRIQSPTVDNIVGIWFILESDLPRSGTSKMRIYLPVGFEPLPNCGIDEYSLSYDHETFMGGLKFPQDKNFSPLPSGTTCEDQYDDFYELHYVEITPDGVLEYGLDYAFQFGIQNAGTIPDLSKNVWRFETRMDGVILHLERDVDSFLLQELKYVSVTPQDTTSMMPLSRVNIELMTEKYIPGGSVITITAPGRNDQGFQPICASFLVFTLSSTTTCSSRGNRITFTVDTQDPQEPNTQFGFSIMISNPDFTPQPNDWSFALEDSFGQFLDIKENLPGYDITGRIDARVISGFSYKEAKNHVQIVFVPSTILNQADLSNILLIEAPLGYTVPAGPCNPSKFEFDYTNPNDLTEGGSISVGVTAVKDFPPEGTECVGFGNNTIEVRLPRYSGLLKFNYTLGFEVMNPPEMPDDNIWMFETRKYTDEDGRWVIVDANRNLAGFDLSDLTAVVEDAGGAFSALRLGPLGGGGVYVYLLALVGWVWWSWSPLLCGIRGFDSLRAGGGSGLGR
jgi:hypothetical protein